MQSPKYAYISPRSIIEHQIQLFLENRDIHIRTKLDIPIIIEFVSIADLSAGDLIEEVLQGYPWKGRQFHCEVLDDDDEIDFHIVVELSKVPSTLFIDKVILTMKDLLDELKTTKDRGQTFQKIFDCKDDLLTLSKHVSLSEEDLRQAPESIGGSLSRKTQIENEKELLGGYRQANL